MMSKVKEKFWLYFGRLILVLGGLPMLFGYLHIGNIALIIYGVLIVTAYWKGKEQKLLWAVVGLITCVGVLFMAVMMRAAYLTPYDNAQPASVVILGCKVSDGEPSLMLEARLREGYQVLSENPEYVCVVSGGLTEGEPLSEAEVMRNYLVERGIDEGRIYLEAASTSTEENIAFSTEIIAQNDLPENIIIATDGFHQLRASYYSEMLGYDTYSVSSLSGFGVVAGYYIREMIAVLRLLLIGMIS